MKYSDDEKIYKIIIEDDNSFMSTNCDTFEELEDFKYSFTGTLQQFGEQLETCGYRQEDIKEAIEAFVKSGFEPNSDLECWVEPGSCYFYLKSNEGDEDVDISK